MDFEIGFFEHLNIAGAERIHSQMIAWFLSEESSPLDEDAKNKFLSELIGATVNYQKINTMTEALNIDIIILADDKDLYAIENKLKSSEHSEQLEKYSGKLEAAIVDKNSPFFNCAIKNKFFLTLIGEKASESGWKNITYQNLLDAAQGISSLPNGNDQIITAYQQTLEYLIGIRDMFLSDHTKFPSVFTDGKKKKSEKKASYNELSGAAKYISDCQLETIFQKQFFHNIVEQLNWTSENAHIGETWGSALFYIDFEEKDVPSIEIENRKYLFSFEVQGSAAKLSFHVDFDEYSGSKKEWIGGAGGAIDIFKKFAKSNPNLRCNSPRSNAYVSLSRKLIPYDHSFDDLCSKYEAARKEFMGFANEMAEELKEIYPR